MKYNCGYYSASYSCFKKIDSENDLADPGISGGYKTEGTRTYTEPANYISSISKSKYLVISIWPALPAQSVREVQN